MKKKKQIHGQKQQNKIDDEFDRFYDFLIK